MEKPLQCSRRFLALSVKEITAPEFKAQVSVENTENDREFVNCQSPQLEKEDLLKLEMILM